MAIVGSPSEPDDEGNAVANWRARFDATARVIFSYCCPVLCGPNGHGNRLGKGKIQIGTLTARYRQSGEICCRSVVMKLQVT